MLAAPSVSPKPTHDCRDELRLKKSVGRLDVDLVYRIVGECLLDRDESDRYVLNRELCCAVVGGWAKTS